MPRCPLLLILSIGVASCCAPNTPTVPPPKKCPGLSTMTLAEAYAPNPPVAGSSIAPAQITDTEAKCPAGKFFVFKIKIVEYTTDGSFSCKNGDWEIVSSDYPQYNGKKLKDADVLGAETTQVACITEV